MSGNRVVFLGRAAVAKVYAERWRYRAEVEALRLVRETGVAPRLLGSFVGVHNRGLVVMTRVGRTTTPHTPPADVSLELLTRVHRVPTCSLPAGRLRASRARQTWRGFLSQRLVAYGNVLGPGRGEKAVRACAAVGELVQDLPDRPLALLHNDPHPTNFVRHPGGARLVDWELAVVGDPLLDLVRFCWEWRLPDDRWRETTGYDRNHPLVRTYRGVHALSRLMAADTSARSTATRDLADRCEREMRDLNLPVGTAGADSAAPP